MGRGSLKASSKGIETAKKALNSRGLTQKALAQKLEKGRSTISKFFNGKPVERYIFEEICERLNLNWEDIFEPPPEEQQSNNSNNFLQIDALVKEIRQKVQADIQQSCGTMRVLDMTQPIDLGSIYTQVNILKKITGRRRLDLNKLWESLNIENFDRFDPNQGEQERVEGLKAVQDYNKLMVLGKPGAGKTTFLKYLAIECSKGDFLKNYVPIFITLKQFAETELENQTKPGLLDYISQWLADCGVIENQAKAEQLLKAGRAFVLLDGLDEVREEDCDRTINQIRELSQKFTSSKFVITCRIAANEYTFTDFSEVEVADFKDEQIQKFAKCWFEIKKLDDYTKDFIQQLQNNPQIKELASNPLLLTLLCLEFEDSRNFPTDRAELYKRATETLLRKWDDKRRIYRQQVYHQLSVKRKEDLLSQIAFTTFNEKQYFFKQRIVENHIADYIINLPDAPTETEKLHLNSQAVLKSIEVQHGLLVERARGIYSFSHLTFQEYFTAEKIVNEQKLPELVEHITETRWKEVFVLVAGMLSNADELLKLMRQKIDELFAEDKKVQEFLSWVNRKANSVETSYKQISVRAYYLMLTLDFTNPELNDYEFSEKNLTLDYILNLSLRYSFILNVTLSPNPTLALNQDFTLEFSQSLSQTFNQLLDIDIATELKQILQNLKDQLPNKNSSFKVIKQWWLQNGESWSKQLRNIMIEYRDIGYDWQFTEKQKTSLQSYLDANNLLLDCLENKNNYVTRFIREEIESTLFLPVQQVEH